MQTKGTRQNARDKEEAEALVKESGKVVNRGQADDLSKELMKEQIICIESQTETTALVASGTESLLIPD